MSSGFHRAEEQDGSKNRWIEDTHQYRREAVEIREQIPSEMVRTPPYRVPQLVDYYNRMLHKYAAQLRPKFLVDDSSLPKGASSNVPEAADLWEEQLAEVQVPKDGAEVHAGEANVHGEVNIENAISRLPTEPKPVSLAALSEWRDAVVTFDVIYRDRRQGECRRRKREVLHLPVWACDYCLDQLNRCLEDLGWLPEAAEKDLEVLEPPEKFE